MSRNSRAHAGTPTQIFKQVWDFETDGGTTAAGAIPLRGQPVPAGWIIYQGYVDIHTALSGGSSVVSLGIATVANWNSVANGVNLTPAEGVAQWAVTAPRALSTGNVTDSRDATVVQVGATAALATLTVTGGDLTGGRLTVYLHAHPADADGAL